MSVHKGYEQLVFNSASKSKIHVIPRSNTHKKQKQDTGVSHDSV